MWLVGSRFGHDGEVESRTLAYDTFNPYCPPNISTSCLLMARPKPVPP